MVGGEIVKLKVRDGDAYDFFKTIKTDEIQVLSGLTYNKDGFVTDYDKKFTDWTVKTGIGTEGEDDEIIGIGDAPPARTMRPTPMTRTWWLPASTATT